MDFRRHENDIDAVVPGVMAAYRALRESHGQGIYTSLGRYYNHTIFGRDAGMTAKFVSDFDHQTVWETILTLASHQGISENLITQEQPGRIHHELRDYTAWQGRWYDRLGLWVAGTAWGMQNRQLRSYYAADTTATYIRLIHKYAANIDRSILERKVPRSDGSTVQLADSVAAAAEWIHGSVDQDGLMRVRRSNRWSLPYQTFADSVTAYAWSSGRPADTSRDHAYVEVQAYALDALDDAARLLPRHVRAADWKWTAERMHRALFERFWQENRHTFAPGLFARDGSLQPLDTDMVTAGWALNASFWKYMPDMKHRARVIALVKRLFGTDFLTDAGLRTRSLRAPEPLSETIDYHGSQTVWPMFNFMVIEGLRRHKLYRLARQLENRLLNTLNALGTFDEFFVVGHDGKLYRPDKRARLKRRGQMIPEQNIAFTVVPALTLAYRHLYRRSTPASDGWRHELESAILAQIPHIELLTPEEARHTTTATPLRITRTLAGAASARHIAPVILKKPR